VKSENKDKNGRWHPTREAFGARVIPLYWGCRDLSNIIMETMFGGRIASHVPPEHHGSRPHAQEVF